MLTPRQIADEFNLQTEKFRARGKETGFDKALQDLSLMIRDLKEAEIDVSLSMIENSSEQAFSMFPPIGLAVPLSGILRIGGMEKMIGLAVMENGRQCLKLAVSDFDIRFNGAHHTFKNGTGTNAVKSTVYDLKDDPEALTKMQKDIIRIAARTNIVQENDITEAFGTHAESLRKPRFKTGL